MLGLDSPAWRVSLSRIVAHDMSLNKASRTGENGKRMGRGGLTRVRRENISTLPSSLRSSSEIRLRGCQAYTGSLQVSWTFANSAQNPNALEHGLIRKLGGNFHWNFRYGGAQALCFDDKN